MPSPFPGMNPYLEHPEIWPEVHHWLIIEMARLLSPQLRPQYKVAVEVRTYQTESPNNGYLEIRQIKTGEVVTLIELLSPTNKHGGRDFYLKKRQDILGSHTHLVEIDLLRTGEPLPLGEPWPVNTHYRILIARGDRYPHANLYAFNISDKIPVFPLPLRPEDQELSIDLQPLLATVYDLASYDLVLDYTQEPVPPLSGPDQAWINSFLQQQNCR